MRSPSLSASLRSCVMKTIVLPTSRCSRMTSFCMSRRISGSSAENGSSKKRISGSTARARARPTRCCMPPESWSGYSCSRPVSPTRSTICCARARRCAFFSPRTSSPYATLPRTRRCGSRPKCWNTIEKRCRRSSRSSTAPASRMSSPCRRICPAVGSTSRVRHRMSVDLPEPDNPMTTNTSPGRTSNETSRTAATHPVLAISSPPRRSASGRPMIFPARGPKIFHSPLTAKTGSICCSAPCTGAWSTDMRLTVPLVRIRTTAAASAGRSARCAWSRDTRPGRSAPAPGRRRSA